MGQIYGFNQMFDADGNPLNEGLIHTYVPGTNTPKATFTTSALSVQLSNPVEADAGGYFPQIFAAEGEVYDLLITDGDGANAREFDDVVALGSSSDDIDLDFGSSGRFAVYGDGGLPQMEFGDPSPDDIGGDGRIGGWDGTRGTNLEIDFANVELTGDVDVDGDLAVTGALTFSGSTGIGMFQLSAASFTAAADVIVNLPIGYQMYDIRFIIRSSTGGVTLRGLLSYDNGGTYKAGAADYTLGTSIMNSNVFTGGSSSTGSAFLDCGDIAQTANQWNTVALTVYTPPSGATATVIQGRASTPVNNELFTGQGIGGYGRATNMKFTPTSGTVTGQVVVFGLNGFV